MENNVLADFIFYFYLFINDKPTYVEYAGYASGSHQSVGLGTGIIFDCDSSKDHFTADECFIIMGYIYTLWNFCYQFYDRAA